jgi:hypothetical protein
MRKLGSAHRAVLSLGAAAGLCVALGSVAWAEDAASHRDQVPPRGGRRPPPEAFRACAGKSEGAECRVAFRGETLDGVCVAPANEELFCLPNDLPPPPDGPPPGRIVM